MHIITGFNENIINQILKYTKMKNGFQEDYIGVVFGELLRWANGKKDSKFVTIFLDFPVWRKNSCYGF
ncbi:MAG: hypothetical protein GY786_10125 [Proteobacteria bacterium]|nr:hypothetical protein [Pseudomonadota bacterium]